MGAQSIPLDQPDLSQQMVQPDAAPQQPGITIPPPGPGVAAQVAHHNKLAEMLDAVSGALGGTKTFDMKRDADGNMVATPRELTHGQQWARIAQTALQGAAAGAQQRGPGSLVRAAGAGVESGVQGQLAREQQGRDRADQDFAAKQKAEAHQANMALAQQEQAKNAWAMQREGIQFSQDQTARHNGVSQLLLDHPGSQDLGVVQHAEDAAQLMAKNPDVINGHIHGQLHVEPEIGDDGKVKGLHAYLVTQDWKDQRNDKPVDIPYVDQTTGDITAEPEIKYHTIPAGAMRNGDIMDSHQAANAAIGKAKLDHHTMVAKDREDASQTMLRTAQAGQARAGATKDYAEAAAARATIPGASGTPNDDAEFETNSGKLAHGTLLLSELPKRTGKGQHTVNQYIARAEQISQKEYGLPFDAPGIIREQKRAEDPKVNAYLDGVDSIVGAAGQPGLIDNLADLARKAGVGPNAPVNEARLAIQKKFGNTAAKNFDTMRGEVQRRVGGLIGNPLLGGGETDKKLEQARNAYGGDVTVENLVGGGQVIKDALSQTRDIMARNNRFIRQRYGSNGTGGPQQQGGGMVTVQIPGSPPGQIPAGALAKFRADHPNAVVHQ